MPLLNGFAHQSIYTVGLEDNAKILKSKFTKIHAERFNNKKKQVNYGYQLNTRFGKNRNLQNSIKSFYVIIRKFFVLFFYATVNKFLWAILTNCTFHLSRPPGFRRAFDATERNRRFGCIQCQRGKESSSRGKRKIRVFLCRRTVGVKVGGKVIPASFLKIEGRGALVGTKGWREGQIK